MIDEFGPRCTACSAETLAWRSALPPEPANADPVLLYKCANCGTAITSGPEPSTLVHDTGSYGGGRPRFAQFASPLLAMFDRHRLILLDTPPPARLLDVGAGRGRFVASARAAGYDALGIEPSRRGVEGAATDYGIPLIQATIDEAELQRESFDVLTVWHVLEHLSDPNAALTRIANWMRPNALALIGVPNVESLQARIGGARWFHFDVPRHRTHYTQAGLEIALRRAGLEPIRTTQLLLEHNPFGMWQSIASRATIRSSYFANLLKRNAPLWSTDLAITLACFALAPAAIALEFLAGLGRRGGTITTLVRRR